MPKGTPRDVIDKVNAEINRALADPKMRERLESDTASWTTLKLNSPAA